MLLLLLIFLLLFSIIFTFVMFTSLVGFAMTRVPYVRTSRGDIEEIVKELPITQKDIFFDLGCGDGKVVFEVERLSGAKGRGFELTLWTHLLSRFKKFVLGSRAEFVLGNFFKQDFSEATIIYCYLFPGLMRSVGEKVLSDCKQNTLVVSRDFPIENLEEIKKWKSKTGHTLYVYQV